MTRKRRYLISAAVLATCVCIALGVLAMLPPRPGVTKANYDRIEKGMTRTEVEAILGEPTVHSEPLGSDHLEMADFYGDGGFAVAIDYHKGVVTSTFWSPSTETLTDKFRRWLRLPK